mmetsp:Transcript_9851/g.25082  ORF Transcript_9851/g.25082 Transcript_9851/m.25082 type:complete len:332 (-) Transcript_9851:2101-3096(-)
MRAPAGAAVHPPPQLRLELGVDHVNVGVGARNGGVHQAGVDAGAAIGPRATLLNVHPEAGLFLQQHLRVELVRSQVQQGARRRRRALALRRLGVLVAAQRHYTRHQRVGRHVLHLFHQPLQQLVEREGHVGARAQQRPHLVFEGDAVHLAADQRLNCPQEALVVPLRLLPLLLQLVRSLHALLVAVGIKAPFFLLKAALASRLQTGVEQVVQAERNEQRIVAEERSAARSGRHFRVLGPRGGGGGRHHRLALHEAGVLGLLILLVLLVLHPLLHLFLLLPLDLLTRLALRLLVPVLLSILVLFLAGTAGGLVNVHATWVCCSPARSPGRAH